MEGNLNFQGIKSECDWTALPEELLDTILNKLISINDHLNFSLVCKYWFSFSLDKRHKIISNFSQLPMLMVPSNDNIEGKQSLYDFTKNKICDFDLKVRYKERCFGSSHGWLIMVEEPIDIILLNPFLGKVINLPPVIREMDIYISEEYSYYPGHFTKSILTKDPLLYPNDYIAVIIYGDNHKLAVINANDETWTYINPNDSPYFEDVNVYNGVIYALDFKLGLWKVDRDSNSSTFSLTRVTIDLDPSPLDPDFNVTYVAESSRGDLLLVQRLIHTPSEQDTYYNTTTFRVYKLSDICELDGMRRHVEVKNLDNDAMFIGDNCSMCVSTKDFPKCLPNRIYYTDNFTFFGIQPQDAGIFNLEDASFSTHYLINPTHRYLPPPIWIIPTLK